MKKWIYTLTIILIASCTLIIDNCNAQSESTNRALDFDGDNDYVNMNDILNNLSVPFTAEAWVYWRGGGQATATYGIITSDLETNYYYRGFILGVTNTGSVIIFLGDGGIAAHSSRRHKNSPANALPLNEWAHIAVVVRGLTNMSIYVNGQDVGGTYDGSGGNMQHSSHPFVIGRYTYQLTPDHDHFFNGVIDEVRIWNTERTLPQIISRMNHTLCQEYYSSLDSGLVGYWQLDSLENLGINSGGFDDVRDMSFLHNHGDIQNGQHIVPGAPILNCDPILPLSLELKVLIEGLYDPVLNRMARKDSITVYLRNTTPPYSLVDLSKGSIDSLSFTGNFSFDSASPGSYFLIIRHINTIETWSKLGIEFNISANIFDFTTSDTKAFGNNQKLVDESPLQFALYSGDVNQDGVIDLTDILQIYNNSFFFATGFMVTDLTGDNLSDLSDLLIAYNNTVKFVKIERP